MINSVNIPVVYYHSVGPLVPAWPRSYLTISPDSFREHLEFFRKNYRVISLKDYWFIRKGEAEPVSKPLIITFDDGYSDNWTWVFPLLKEYDIKATIFVSPEFADGRDILRSGNEDRGFLSWHEMKVMEGSGLVDIQSHTLTHTKYFVSDTLTGFHHPGADILYAISNLYPEKKPDSISGHDFEKLLPYGFPLFEDKSSVIARKVEINPDFIGECLHRFRRYNFERYSFQEAYNLIEPVYTLFRGQKSLIVSTESEEEYLSRVKHEITESKKIIEARLDKKVEFLCWPHGDNNEMLHMIALDAGYLMTTRGRAENVREDDISRIPERLGVDFSTWRKRQKTIFKLKAFSGTVPYYSAMGIIRKYGHWKRW